MGRLFNLDSPLMVFLSKVADLMILNIITLFLCIPIITAGDAMTALYYMTIKMVRGEDCYIVRGYFKSFKENFKQATIIWVLAVLVFLILNGDFSIIRSGLLSFGRVMTVLLIIITVIYVFTIAVCVPGAFPFENTVKNTIRNAFLMSILNLPQNDSACNHQPDSVCAASAVRAVGSVRDPVRLFRARLSVQHAVCEDFQTL